MVLRPEAYPNPPAFLHGHNARIAEADRKRNDPCLCGCGDMPKTLGRKWCPGHQHIGRTRSAEIKAKLSAGKMGGLNPRFGQRPANYKGWFRHPDGYILVHSPDHPFGGVGGRVMQHRLIMEEHLRHLDPYSPFLVTVNNELYLSRDFEVHHKNHVKDDNRLENLQVLSKRAHAELHAAERNAISPPKRVRKKKPVAS